MMPVIRELDFSKRKDKSSTTVLKWIESCMLKHPSWIHVQNSLENLPVGASTPPASPLHFYSASPPCAGAFSDLMSPTNGDRVLNCALLFSSTVFDGQVALLTNDTALKIKAMAEVSKRIYVEHFGSLPCLWCISCRNSIKEGSAKVCDQYTA